MFPTTTSCARATPVRSFVVLGTALLVAIALAACGGSDAVTEPAAPPLAVQVDAAASPIEARLGFPSDPTLRHYQLYTMQRSADAAIAQCMQRSGFFYAIGFGVNAFGQGASTGDGSREWTEVHGLGVASSFAQALASGGDAAVADPVASNLGYVSSLTAEESAAYDRALIGDAPAATATGSFEPGGCWSESFTEILSLLAVLERFEPELELLNSRLQSDPRVQAFQQSWSACMSDAGYRFDNEQALIDDLYARLLLIDVEAGAQQRSTQVDQLLTYERQVGLASFDCRLTFADELASLRNDYEREFLDDNRFVIADLLGPTQ